MLGQVHLDPLEFRGLLLREVVAAGLGELADGVAALLAFLVAVAFAAWGFGQLQDAQRLLPVRWTDPAVHATKRFSELTDVWAFGVILFELLTGRLLFTGSSVGEVWGKIQYEPIQLKDP
ncbi:MAG TPA: hypothetical protein EYQ24_12155, partial [Bacteroidetes bacterium]|nr:hypothetical protein [Bacteroidota bacterium]